MKKVIGTLYFECDLCYDHTSNVITCYKFGQTFFNLCFYMNEKCGYGLWKQFWVIFLGVSKK